MAKRNYRAEYMRERKNALRRLNRLVGKGYQLNLDVDLGIPSDFISYAEYRKFKSKVKSENVLKKAKYETETGQVISGTEARKRERSASARKAAERRRERRSEPQDITTPIEVEIGDKVVEPTLPIFEDIVIQRLYDLIDRIDNWTPTSEMTGSVPGVKYRRLQELKGTILSLTSTKEDKIRVGENIQRNAEQLNELLDRLMYAVYRRDYETNRSGTYDFVNGYTPEGDYMMILRILNS